MLLSRKDFLALSGMASMAMLMPGCTVPSETYRLREGAGLLFDADAVPRLRGLFDGEPMFASVREGMESFDRAAMRRFLADEVKYHDHLFDLARVFTAAEQMSFYYLMTGDEDAAALAVESLDALEKFPTWDFILEGGVKPVGLQRASAVAMAIALGTEWLGYAITAEQRTHYLKLMGERGLEPCFTSLYGMRHNDRVEGWALDETSGYLEHRPGDRGMDLSRWPYILNLNNHKTVPTRALLVGSFAYQREFGESDLTRRWLEQALHSFGTLGELFKPDGSYEEGVSYAFYAASHIADASWIISQMMLDRREAVLNWKGFVEYLAQMSAPTHTSQAAVINFGDCGSAGTSAVPFLLAKWEGDAKAQWLGLERCSGHDLRSLIWYDASLQPETPPQEPSLWKCDMDWVVARTGSEVEDLVVAMRSGPPANHEHADRNSVVVNCFGERLVDDPNRPPYTRTDPSWMMRWTAGHSAVLVNGQSHQYHDGSEGTNAAEGHAHITEQGTEDGVMHWSSDATQAYALVDAAITSVVRSVHVVPELHAVVLLDQIAREGEGVELEARYFADNADGGGDVAANGGGLRIRRPKAFLEGTFLGSGEVAVSTDLLPIAPEMMEKYPFGRAVTHGEGKAWLVSVLCAGKDGLPAAKASIDAADGGEVLIELARGGAARTLRLRVFA